MSKLNCKMRSVVLAGLLALAIQFVAAAQPGASDEAWGKADEIVRSIVVPTFPDRDYLITDFGGVGDGKTMCTDAFRKAVTACHDAGGGRVVVPSGKFLSGAIHLKSNVNLHVSEGAVILFSQDPADYLPVVFTRWEGVECMNYSPLIYAFEQENVAITGKGTLDGQADDEHWWPWKGKTSHGWKEGEPNQSKARNKLFDMGQNGVSVKERVFGTGSYLRPNFIQPYRCKNVLIEGVTIRSSPMWELHPVLCKNVTVRGVTVISHGPNNDGCDPESSSNVLIEKCLFDTGDDCIALKSGRNNDGRRVNRPIENVVVRDCVMKDGHGGVVIGSEISGGARNIFAENCQMDSPNLDRMLRIKTNSVRGGLIENIYLRNIKVGEVADAIFRVNFLYEEGDADKFTPTVRNVHISNISSDKSKYGLYLQGYKRSPVTGIFLENCSFNNLENGNVLVDVEDVHFKDVTMNGKTIGSLDDAVRVLESDVAISGSAKSKVLFSDDFEDGKADEWDATKGEWEVAEADGGRVYHEFTDGEGRAHLKDASWQDFRVEARVKVVQFGGETRAFLCGRYVDGGNYYAASLYNRDEGGMIELRCKLNGATKELVRKNLAGGVKEGHWYKVAIEMRGDTIQVYVDDELQLTAKDSSLTEGSVGLIAYKSRVQYDDVVVTELKGER